MQGRCPLARSTPDAPRRYLSTANHLPNRSRALILQANAAARRLLGEPLVGRHWQELVIPGSHDDVQPVLEMIRAAGEVVSRFRIPGADRRLVEFDSHTRIDGDMFVTTMRPIEPP